jgi:hypothetical protein
MLSVAIVLAIVIALLALASVILYYDHKPSAEPLPVWTDQFTRTAVDLGDPTKIDLDTPPWAETVAIANGLDYTPVDGDDTSNPAAGLSGDVTTDRG